MEYLKLFGGLALLIVSGNFLVNSATDIARRLKISSLVIGLTIVAFGTSAPELLVSAEAALSGHPEIALGNVLGSNIANIGFIAGLTAILLPFFVTKKIIKLDIKVMILFAVLFTFFAYDGEFNRIEGGIVFLLLIAYTILLLWMSKKSNEEAKFEDPRNNLWLNILIFISSLAGLAFGSDFMVDGASTIATNLGVSERVISVTLVAFGTSVPELATSIMAAIRKENDIAIGNVVGSNIFNILFVIGGSALITPIENFDFTAFSFDFYWMIIFTAILALTVIPFERIAKKIKDEKTYSILTRFEGFSMIAAYIVYVILLLN